MVFSVVSHTFRYCTDYKEASLRIGANDKSVGCEYASNTDMYKYIFIFLYIHIFFIEQTLL